MVVTVAPISGSRGSDGGTSGTREVGTSVVDMIMNAIVVLIVAGLFIGIIMLWRSTQ
jgi:hypothetical protein